jgi:hypothetical protein
MLVVNTSRIDDIQHRLTLFLLLLASYLPSRFFLVFLRRLLKVFPPWVPLIVLFELQYLGKAYTSNVGIISSLVVVRQEL